MAKKTTAVSPSPGSSPKKFKDVLLKMEPEMQQAGITLSAKELEFLVKLVKACQ